MQAGGSSRLLDKSPNKRPRLHEADIDWGQSPHTEPPSADAAASLPDSPGNVKHPHGGKWHSQQDRRTLAQLSSEPQPGQHKSALQRQRPAGRKAQQPLNPGRPALEEADIEWGDEAGQQCDDRQAPNGARPRAVQQVSVLKGGHKQLRQEPRSNGPPSNPFRLIEAQIDWGGDPAGGSKPVLSASKGGPAAFPSILADNRPSAPSKSLLDGPRRMARDNTSQDIHASTVTHRHLQKASGAQQKMNSVAKTAGKLRAEQPQAEKGPPSHIRKQMETIHRLKVAESRQPKSVPQQNVPASSKSRPALVPQAADIDW